MSVALIADAHLGGPGGAAEPLVEQLLALPEQGCSRLILLGDLFQAWIGNRRYETPEIETVVGALETLSGLGLPVDYVEGNRDFFLAESPYAAVFHSIVRETAFEAGGVRYLAVHGDGLDTRDRLYRFWRGLSKSLPVRLLMQRLPRRLARRLVGSTERRLSQVNLAYKRQIPEAAIRGYAEGRLAEGYDVLLLGHFHEERRWPVTGGEVWLLDAWFHSRRVEWVGRS